MSRAQVFLAGVCVGLVAAIAVLLGASALRGSLRARAPVPDALPAAVAAEKRATCEERRRVYLFDDFRARPTEPALCFCQSTNPRHEEAALR